MRPGFADRSQANLPDRHRALSTAGVFCAERLLELARPGCGAKHGQVPGIHAMDTPVVRPTNKPGTQ